jgi:cation transport ATPase
LIWGAYAAGNTFADTISKYLTYIIFVIAGVTVIPLGWEIFKEWRSRKHLS